MIGNFKELPGQQDVIQRIVTTGSVYSVAVYKTLLWPVISNAVKNIMG